MQAMTESGDGFELAERDLAIRGAGEVFGERQAGWTDLKLGRLPQDEAIVFEARGVAEQILDADPDLERHAQLREEVAGPPRRRRRVPVQVVAVAAAPRHERRTAWRRWRVIRRCQRFRRRRCTSWHGTQMNPCATPVRSASTQSAQPPQ